MKMGKPREEMQPVIVGGASKEENRLPERLVNA